MKKRIWISGAFGFLLSLHLSAQDAGGQVLQAQAQEATHRLHSLLDSPTT